MIKRACAWLQTANVAGGRCARDHSTQPRAAGRGPAGRSAQQPQGSKFVAKPGAQFYPSARLEIQVYFPFANKPPPALLFTFFSSEFLPWRKQAPRSSEHRHCPGDNANDFPPHVVGGASDAWPWSTVMWRCCVASVGKDMP